MSSITSDSRYEHLDVDKRGYLRGLYKVDGSKAMGVGIHNYWGRIEEIIEDYTRLHPKEMMECLRHAAVSREMAFNAYGLNKEDKNSELRNGISIPNGLLIAIMTFDPEFLENKSNKLTQFRKRFSGFNTSKRI